MKYPIILFALVLFSVTSCSTGEAKKVVEEFHQRMDANEFDYICDHLISETALEHSGRAEWMNLLTTVDSWGEQKNREQKFGFSTKINNGVSTVKLKYTFEIDNTIFYESFVVTDDGNGEKISVYAVNTNESTVDNYTSDY